MATIIPAILVETLDAFRERLETLPDAETFSIDIMNGTFVSPTTFFDADAISTLHTDAQFELDLMVSDPLPIVEAWNKLPNTIRAIVHAEIDTDVRDVLRTIRGFGLEAGLALLPKTAVEDVEYLLNETDMVLVRGNEPGFSGRPYLHDMTEKIRALHAFDPSLLINVDIGVNDDTIPTLVTAGATHLSVNSAIFGEVNPADALKRLQTLANTT